MQTTRHHIREMIVLFFCGLLLFTWGLQSQEVIGFDSRFYLFAMEMLQNGGSWFPTTYQQPYPDYSAAATSIISALALIFGGLNKLIAVLPTAILATLTLCVTYAIGVLHSKRWGWYAVCFMLLTCTFLKSARSISLDMYPTFITTACFYLVYSADLSHQPKRVWWVYPLLLLSFIFRGPIGLVIPAGVVCTYYLLERRPKQCMLFGSLAFTLLIIGTSMLSALAYAVGGAAFMQDVLRMQVWGRIGNVFLPRYFYFTSSIGDYALSYPLAWLVLGGMFYYLLIKRKPTAQIKLLMQLCGWMLVILLGMSIPGDKKIRYILPMLPAVALIAAYPLAMESQLSYFRYLRTVLQGFFFLLPLLMLLVVLSVFSYGYDYDWNSAIHYATIFSVLMVLQGLSCWVTLYYRNNVRDAGIVFIATGCFVYTMLAVVEPLELYLDRTRDFVTRIEVQRLQQQANLVFYKEHPDGLPIKYLVNMKRSEQPVFIHTLNELIAFSRPAFFVTSTAYFAELPKTVVNHFRVIDKSDVGHIPVVVFVRK